MLHLHLLGYLLRTESLYNQVQHFGFSFAELVYIRLIHSGLVFGCNVGDIRTPVKSPIGDSWCDIVGFVIFF